METCAEWTSATVSKQHNKTKNFITELTNDFSSFPDDFIGLSENFIFLDRFLLIL
jgi:hypothetical protein